MASKILPFSICNQYKIINYALYNLLFMSSKSTAPISGQTVQVYQLELTLVENQNNDDLNKTEFLYSIRGGFPGSLAPAIQETQVQSLGWEDPLEKGMATCSSFLPGEFHGQRRLVRLQSMGLKRVRHDWVTNTYVKSQSKIRVGMSLHNHWVPVFS